jgi:ketosteroid isomerase-like protein
MKILDVTAFATCACLASLPSEAQTGKLLSQADVAKINQSTETFVKATLAKDWATVAALYIDDAILNPPNEPAARGRAAIRAWLEKFPPITGFTASNLRVEGRDDLAYVLGTYAMTIALPGGPGPVKDSGKYVEVRRRQPDGRWLIAVDIFNSDLAATPPPK